MDTKLWFWILLWWLEKAQPGTSFPLRDRVIRGESSKPPSSRRLVQNRWKISPAITPLAPAVAAEATQLFKSPINDFNPTKERRGRRRQGSVSGVPYFIMEKFSRVMKQREKTTKTPKQIVVTSSVRKSLSRHPQQEVRATQQMVANHLPPPASTPRLASVLGTQPPQPHSNTAKTTAIESNPVDMDENEIGSGIASSAKSSNPEAQDSSSRFKPNMTAEDARNFYAYHRMRRHHLLLEAANRRTDEQEQIEEEADESEEEDISSIQNARLDELDNTSLSFQVATNPAFQDPTVTLVIRAGRLVILNEEHTIPADQTQDLLLANSLQLAHDMACNITMPTKAGKSAGTMKPCSSEKAREAAARAEPRLMNNVSTPSHAPQPSNKVLTRGDHHQRQELQQQAELEAHMEQSTRGGQALTCGKIVSLRNAGSQTSPQLGGRNLSSRPPPCAPTLDSTVPQIGSRPLLPRLDLRELYSIFKKLQQQSAEMASSSHLQQGPNLHHQNWTPSTQEEDTEECPPAVSRSEESTEQTALFALSAENSLESGITKSDDQSVQLDEVAGSESLAGEDQEALPRAISPVIKIPRRITNFRIYHKACHSQVLSPSAGPEILLRVQNRIQAVQRRCHTRQPKACHSQVLSPSAVAEIRLRVQNRIQAVQRRCHTRQPPLAGSSKMTAEVEPEPILEDEQGGADLSDGYVSDPFIQASCTLDQASGSGSKGRFGAAPRVSASTGQKKLGLAAEKKKAPADPPTSYTVEDDATSALKPHEPPGEVGSSSHGGDHSQASTPAASTSKSGEEILAQASTSGVIQHPGTSGVARNVPKSAVIERRILTLKLKRLPDTVLHYWQSKRKVPDQRTTSYLKKPATIVLADEAFLQRIRIRQASISGRYAALQIKKKNNNDLLTVNEEKFLRENVNLIKLENFILSEGNGANLRSRKPGSFLGRVKFHFRGNKFLQNPVNCYNLLLQHYFNV